MIANFNAFCIISENLIYAFKCCLRWGGEASRWNAVLIKHVFNVFLTVETMRNNKTILILSIKCRQYVDSYAPHLKSLKHLYKCLLHNLQQPPRRNGNLLAENLINLFVSNLCKFTRNFFFYFVLWIILELFSLMLSAILSQPDGDEDGLKWILIYVGALFRGYFFTSKRVSLNP